MKPQIIEAARGFAVFIPNFNHGRFLPAALDAILAQSVQPREICILDDASTDDSVRVITDYAARHAHIRPILLTENRGILLNLSDWLAASADEFVFFSAADDMIRPGLFERSLAMLTLHPQAGLCSAPSRLLSLDGRDMGRFITPHPLNTPGYIPPPKAARLLMRDDTWMMGNTTIYRRAALIAAGGFRPELGALTDGYASRLIALRDGACFIPDELGYWRRDDAGFAGQATRDIEKSCAISDAAVQAIETHDRNIFPPGYARRWRQRWLYSVLARHASNEPTHLPDRFMRLVRQSTGFDHMVLSLLASWSATWPQLAYAFLRMRPFDLWPAGLRRLRAFLAIRPAAERTSDLTQADSHYAFGKNWSAYSVLIDEDRLKEAVNSVAKLCGDLAGKSFLDIGCGSGLFSAAALRLGATPLRAIDIDCDSVETTQQTLTRFFPGDAWSCAQRSVFDTSPQADGLYDVVYSWGVLHHTGNMRQAIACAAQLVAPGGLLVLGLYRKTPFCRFWTVEKRLYTHGPRWVAAVLRWIYKSAYLAGILATGRDPRVYVHDYQSNRGMDWHHDVEDWLGGYPYESVSNSDMARLAHENGFVVRATYERAVPASGLFGSLIVEYTLAQPPAVPT